MDDFFITRDEATYIHTESHRRTKCKSFFRHRRQHAAVDPAAGRLPAGLRRDRDFRIADDVSTTRHHVSGAHRALHEATDHHAAGLEEQFDARRDSWRPHVLRRVHAEAGHRLRAQ